MKREVLPSGLARFITWQMATIIGIFLVLTIAFGLVTSRLERMADRINAEAVRTDNANDIAIELLMYRRDTLLARLTDDTGLLMKAEGRLTAVSTLVDQLTEMVTEPGERGASSEILRQYAVFQEAIQRQSAARPEEIRGLVDRVIDAVGIYRQLMQQRMDAVAEEGRELNRLADGVIWSLLVVIPIVLAASGLALWRRIAKPVFSLVEIAERFRAEDMGARSPIYRDDELGVLCRTFNSMATDIQARDKDRHDFMCAVVHDLSSPIAVIGGAANLLLKGLPPDKARSWHERILVQSNRLSAMNDDLLESARIGAEQLRIEPEMTDLSSLVAFIVKEQRLVHGQRVINWRETEPCRLLIDEKRITRVLVNLITNAIKYSEPPDEIDVRLEVNPRSVIVAITDHGSGMTREDIHELFKPFGRLARTERKTRGTGLGLFSVKKIVEAHDGAIEIDSEPGHGTTVRVVLPRNGRD